MQKKLQEIVQYNEADGPAFKIENNPYYDSWPFYSPNKH